MIVTFYSYKGGLGRSMAVANVAVLLARDGYRVIVVDWDLEAPGIHRFFNLTDRDLAKPTVRGVIEYVLDFKAAFETEPQDDSGILPNLDEYLLPLTDVDPALPKEMLRFVPAGRLDETYANRISSFDWENFYKHWYGGRAIEYLKQELLKRADYVLVDSRTGLTDIGGICTMQLPSVLVLVMGSNWQSVDGALKVIKSLETLNNPPKVLPVPSRIDKVGERDLLQEWLRRFADEFSVPSEVGNRQDYFDRVIVPYQTAYSYQEGLAVLEEEVYTRGSVPDAYQQLKAYIQKLDPRNYPLLKPTDLGMGDGAKGTLTIGARKDSQDRGLPTQGVIFLSYAREDRDKVENLHGRLSDAGFKPWMDTKEILPGEAWAFGIQKAIRSSDFFLACLSPNSVSKRGSLQTEIRDALRIWQEKLESDIHLIPVRLEDCQIPESLRDFQWVDLFEKDGWDKLVRAMQIGKRGKEERLRAASEFVDREAELRMLTNPIDNPGAPRYMQVYAPCGLGKTYLLKKTRTEYEKAGWLCAWLDFSSNETLRHQTSLVLEQLGRQLGARARKMRTCADLAQQVMRAKKESAILLDAVDLASGEVRGWIKTDLIQSLEERIPDPKFRPFFIAAGRYPIREWAVYSRQSVESTHFLTLTSLGCR